MRKVSLGIVGIVIWRTAVIVVDCLFSMNMYGPFASCDGSEMRFVVFCCSGLTIVAGDCDRSKGVLIEVSPRFSEDQKRGPSPQYFAVLNENNQYW